MFRSCRRYLQVSYFAWNSLFSIKLQIQGCDTASATTLVWPLCPLMCWMLAVNSAMKKRCPLCRMLVRSANFLMATQEVCDRCTRWTSLPQRKCWKCWMESTTPKSSCWRLCSQVQLQSTSSWRIPAEPTFFVPPAEVPCQCECCWHYWWVKSRHLVSDVAVLLL